MKSTTMKKSFSFALALMSFTIAKGQSLEDESTFVSSTQEKVSVNDTLKIGLPVSGQSSYLFIEDVIDKKIKKGKRAADGARAIGSVVGLGGLKGALTGIKIGRAAGTVSTAAGAADVINGYGIIKPDQIIVITKFYRGDDNEILAEAKNTDNNKYVLKINNALMLKEVVSKDKNIYSKGSED